VTIWQKKRRVINASIVAKHLRSHYYWLIMSGQNIREKKAAAAVMGAEQINKTVEAIGILKGLQVSPHLSDEEKKILGNVAKIIEGLLADIQ
jgi:hypothetical protein